MNTADDGDGPVPTARELFAERLTELFAAAGKPSLETVHRHTVARLGERRRIASIKRISDWRLGRNVPAQFGQLEPILVTLRAMAKQVNSTDPVMRPTIGAWQQLWHEARRNPVAARAIPSSAPDTLPRDVTLIGRERELADIADLAERGRVVSISGMPGVGKTAFVTTVAHRLSGAYPDGRLFVDLHAHSDKRAATAPADVLAGLLTAVGMDSREMPDSLEMRRDRWREHVADRRILLVLDDARDEAQLEPLLPNGGKCLTVITGRRKLVMLNDSEPFVLEAMEPDRAGELFCTRARRDPAGHDREAVAEIVRLCGYLPLPIVLIAGRVAHHPAWTVSQVCAELATTQDRLGEFEIGELAVRAAFTMSYDDLPPHRQRMFRRLGLHPGHDIDKYAAAALDEIGVPAARRELEALFTDHLLQEQVQGRYRMHDLLRVYAGELAAGDPPDDRRAVLDRVLGYYWHVGAVADRQLGVETRSRSPLADRKLPAVPRLANRAQALAWLRAERETLLDCVQFAATHGRATEAVGLTGVVAGLLLLDGPWPAAIDLHQRAGVLAASGRDRCGAADTSYNLGAMRYATGDYAGAAGPMEQAAALYSKVECFADHARAVSILGALAYARGEYPRTADLMTQASQVYEREGDRSAEAYARLGVGMALYATGDYPEAKDQVNRALDTFTEIGDRSGEAYAHSRLGVVRYATGKCSQAVTEITDAHGIYRELGDRFGEAHALNDLASALFATADYPGASAAAWEALAIFRDMGDRVGEAYTLGNLARLHFVACEWKSATDAMESAKAIFTDIGDRVGEAYAANDLSLTHYVRGNYPETLDQMRAALAVFTEIGDKAGQGYTLIGLGLVNYAGGNYAAAADPLGRALDIFEAIGDKVGQAYVLATRGRLFLATGENDEADDQLTRASDIFEAIGDRVGQAYVLISRGRLNFVLGDGPGAIAQLEQAANIYGDTEIGDRFGAAFAQGGVALLHYATGNSVAAIGPAEESVRIFRSIGDLFCHAHAFVGLGLLRYTAGEHARAAAMVEEASAMFRVIGDRLGEAYTFIGAGLLSAQIGDYSNMANWRQKGLAIFRTIGDQPRRVEILEQLTNAWDEAADRPQDAIMSYIEALRSMRELQIRWRKRSVWRDLPIPATRR